MPLDVQTSQRLRLRQAGYSPLPVEGKRPVIEKWEQQINSSNDEISLWGNVYNLASNTGILTRLTPTLDIDILQQEAAEAIEALAREHFEERGYILVRIGKAPKRAILLRTDEPFGKINGSVIAPDGSAQKIELLCNGQQVVVFGIHPETHAPYRWHGGEPGQIAWEDLPYVRASEAAGFVHEAVDLLVTQFGYTRPPERPKTNGADRGAGSSDWSWLITNLRDGKELHDSADILAAKLVSSGMNDGAAVNLLRGLFDACTAPHDHRWQERYDDIPRDVASARSKFGDNQQPKPGPKPAATPYVFLAEEEEESMRKREFYDKGRHYVCGYTTSTSAPGGGGKTTLLLYELITMALEGRRVWYISGEDPRDEIDRRILAHCKHHNLTKADTKRVAASLFVDDRESFPLSLGASQRAAAVRFDETWLPHFEGQIRANRINVVVLDPFVSFHSVPETDNGAIDQVVKRLAGIAKATSSCIELSHHVRKTTSAGGQTELTVDDSRGGSAIVNAVRSARIFNRMTANEAALANVGSEQRASYVRVDKGKRNMAPPENANWWRIVSVILPNGDNVQAIEPYKFPDAFAEMSTAQVDWVQKFLREAGPKRASSQSPDWLGHHLGRHCDRNDTHEKGGAIWANKILSKWLANKIFQKVDLRDPISRKWVPYYADRDFKPPEDGNVVPFPVT